MISLSLHHGKGLRIYNDTIHFSYSRIWSILVIGKGFFLRFTWPSRFISEIEAICRQWLADGPKILMVLLCLGPHIQACGISCWSVNLHSCSKKVQSVFLRLKTYAWSNVNWSMGKECILWSIISWNLQKVSLFFKTSMLLQITSAFIPFSHSHQYLYVGKNTYWEDDTHSMQLSFGVEEFLVRFSYVAFIQA